MKNINAQQWLDENYPLNEPCTKINDINKGKKRSEIDTLIINNENLTGSLNLTGFTKLQGFNCSNQSLESLNLNDCTNLLVADAKNNNLKCLDLKNCDKLESLDISYNRELKELDLSNNHKLKTVNVNNCSSLKISNVIKAENLQFNHQKYCFDLSQISNAENQIRNVLVIGWTGNGKSNLANCLTNSNQFISKNSSKSITETYKKSEIFEHNGNRYCIIDNVGFGDTRNLTKRDLLYKIAEGIHSSREGINQIFFVAKERFTQNHIEAFRTFESLINQIGITKFTTIVRTNFNDYRSDQSVENDKEKLIKNSEIKNLIESCNDIIYINAPPLQVINDEDDELEKEIKELENEEAIDKREESKEILFEHLTGKCNWIYKLKGWESFSEAVDDHFRRIKVLENQLSQSNNNSSQVREEINREQNQVSNILLERINVTTGGVSMIASIIQVVIGFMAM